MDATCDTCHNIYDKTFQVIMDGRTHTFDSFECAIHALAPVCSYCACKIIGHGVEAENKIYCCAHCAKRSGITDVRDRSGEHAGYMNA